MIKCATINNWTMALAIVGIFATIQWLDGTGPSLIQEQIDQAQATADALQAQDRDLRLKRASYIICRDALGKATPSWTLDGELVCTPKLGKPQTQGITMAQVQL